MCGIIGYLSENPAPEDLKLLKNIFKESKIRGLHAFGFTSRGALEHPANTFKSLAIEEILTGLDICWPFHSMIGHTRYSTSGDWKEASSNQPIEHGGVHLAFNGVISGGTQEENKARFGLNELSTDNDGEIFLRYYAEKRDLNELARSSKMSFAGLLLDGWNLIPFRNSRRPLWRAQVGGSFFWASTADIFQRAGILGVATEFEEVGCNLE